MNFCSCTHVSQKLPESNQELIRKFAKFNEDLRWDNNLELSQIANMDETQLFINIPNTKMIAKISSKEVNIKAHGQERIHVVARL